MSIVAYSQKARFQTTATGSQINFQNLLVALGATAVSATDIYSDFFAIKINKIRIYGAASTTSGANSIIFEWLENPSAAQGVKPTSYSGGSVGTAFGSYMEFKPPKNSLWGNWVTAINPGSIPVFTVTMPANSILEVDFHGYVENNDTTVNKTGFSGLIAGSHYRMGLDGFPVASSTWKTIGYRQA